MTPHERESAEWIKRLKAGDPEATYDLWKLLLKYAYSLAYRKKLKDASVIAEDIAQIAFIKIFKRINKENSKPIENIKAYSKMIVVRETINKCKAEIRRRKIEERMQAQFEVEGQPISVEQSLKILAPCLEKLPEKDRKVIQEQYFLGKSGAEMGEDFGEKPNTVRQWAYRARQQLLKCLKENGYEGVDDFL